MRRLNTVTALVFLALGLYSAQQAPALVLFTSLGPGPGFVPMSLGIFMAVLSVIWLGQIYTRPVASLGKLEIPSPRSLGRVACVIGSIMIFAGFVDTLGYQLSMFALLVFLLMGLGRQRIWVTALVSIAGSFGIYYIFTELMQVSLPTCSVGFLANLGL